MGGSKINNKLEYENYLVTKLLKYFTALSYENAPENNQPNSTYSTRKKINIISLMCTIVI